MSERLCEPRFVAAGLPGRTPVLIDRDRRMYPYHLERMAFGNTRREPGDAGPLAHDVLLALLADTERSGAASAAFVAGRCTTGHAADERATQSALQALADSFDPAHLESDAATYVEALFSLALLGDVDGPRQLLTDLVTVPELLSIAAYLAAFYLAQLGSADGYAVLHADLHDHNDAHNRMMAARHLLGFVSYDGQAAGKLVIDVRAELLHRLDDRDETVAQIVPGLLAETGLPDVADDLVAASKRGLPSAVRDAIDIALASLGDG